MIIRAFAAGLTTVATAVVGSAYRHRAGPAVVLLGLGTNTPMGIEGKW